MSDSGIHSAEINLPLLKWMTSFKLNRDLFATPRNQSLKSINEIFRDLQNNIIPPKDEELQNLFIHLYDLNNYYSNSIDYQQVEKSLNLSKSKYRNNYLKGYFEIINLFQSIANDFDPTNYSSNLNGNGIGINGIGNKTNNSILNTINNRKNDNKENSFKFLSSFEHYVPLVEDIKRIYCIDNKEIQIDKSSALPVEYKLFHSFSLLHLYVFQIIVIRIFRLISEIYRLNSDPELLVLVKENSNHVKSIEDFQIILKSNNLFYINSKKEILLKYSVAQDYQNSNNSNNGSSTTTTTSKTFEFTEKELRYSKKNYSYNEFTLRPGELYNSNNNIETEIEHIIFYTTNNSNNHNGNVNGSGSNLNSANSSNSNSIISSNSISSNSANNSSGSLISNNKFKINHHTPKDIKPKVILAIYNNILSNSKLLETNTNSTIIINNNNNNINTNFINESEDSFDNFAGIEQYQLIDQVKECNICRFRSEFIKICCQCQCKWICQLCSVNRVCWDCYFKKEDHAIPLEIVVKLKDRQYPRLIYMLLRSYSFRDLMNTLYQDRFERDTTISAKDRLTYKLHKTKLYNFNLVLPNYKDPTKTKEIKIFDDYSLIVSLRLLMHFILSNYIIDQDVTITPQPITMVQSTPIPMATSTATRPISPPPTPSQPTLSPTSGNPLLDYAISRNYILNSGGGGINEDDTSNTSNTNNSSNNSGSKLALNQQQQSFRKNSTSTAVNYNNPHHQGDNINNHYQINTVNNNSIVTIENPILFGGIDKFIMNITESTIEIEQSLKIPSANIETEKEAFASGGQAMIYMVKHIEWPLLSNCPEDSFVFKQFVEIKDSLQIEEDREREMYEEKIYHAYKNNEGIENFKYNFSNVEQTDKKSLETLFYEEVDKLKQLQFSEYVVKMPAISDDNPNKRGMLLEYAAAGSLKTNLLEYRSWKLVIRFMMDICLGMIDIHKCSIIHRDLKPDNILVFENGTGQERLEEFGGLICKITDLGASIQKVLVHDNNFSSTFHTDDYVPSEYGKYQYDEKVDIYSFGCTFFEMVTKHRYQYKHPTPLHRDFFTTDFQFIPIRIKSLIASCLSSLDQRKQSFEEVYIDLLDIYKNVIPSLPDIPYNPKSSNGSQFCKRCNPIK